MFAGRSNVPPCPPPSSSTTPSFLSLSVSVFYVCLCVRQLRAYIDCRHITPGTWLAIDLKGWRLAGS